MEKIKKVINLSSIVYIALSLYMLDVILLGTGDLFKVEGVSSRIVFFAIAFLGSLPFILKDLKKVLRYNAVSLIVIFGCFVLLAAVYGFLNGNYMPILISDIKGYLNLLIIFPMMYTLYSKESVLKLLKILLNIIFVISIICIILSYFQFFSEDFQVILYRVVHDIGWASLTILTKTATRVFLHSGTRMLALGLLLALAFLMIEEKKKPIRYIQMTCCLVALYISYARAIYLGLFLSIAGLMVGIFVFYKEYLRDVMKYAISVLVLTAIFIVVIGFTQGSNLFEIGWNRCVVAIGGDGEILDPSLTPSIEPSTEDISDANDLVNLEAEKDSLNIRDYRISMALKNFSKSPIWGNGLGVVNDLNYYTGIEYFYLDLLSKMGIIGLVLFLAPAIVTLINIIKKRYIYVKEQKILSLLMWFMLLYMMIISYFNPCMNTSWGLMIYGLAIVLGIPWKNQIK